MAGHAHTFRLGDTDPRERALQRRLEDLARTREKASTIVEAFVAYDAGDAGGALISLPPTLAHPFYSPLTTSPSLVA